MNCYRFGENAGITLVDRENYLNDAALSVRSVFCFAPFFGDQRCFTRWVKRYYRMLAERYPSLESVELIQKFPLYYVELSGQGARLAEGFAPYQQEYKQLIAQLQAYENKLSSVSQLAIFGISLAGILARNLHAELQRSFCFVDSTPFFDNAFVMAQGFKLGFKKFRTISQNKPEFLSKEFTGFAQEELDMLAHYLRHLSDEDIELIAQEGANAAYLSLSPEQQKRFFVRIGDQDPIKKCIKKLQRAYPSAQIQCLEGYNHVQCFVQAPKNYAEWIISGMKVDACCAHET